MCGIVAAITSDCYTKLLQCLYQIQNRGYDSAGIATLSNGLINEVKSECM